MDAQVIGINTPQIFEAPADDPEYRWVNYDDPDKGKVVAHDAKIAVPDWSLLDGILDNFPNPAYPGLLPHNPEQDGRYRLGLWWFCFFERHWSLRGMTNALMDYYTDPESVHRLFRALTDFNMAIMERAKNEIIALQQVQQQTSIYRHDMRHHLSLLNSYLEAGDTAKAGEYIKQTQTDIDKIVPVRYCENNAVNLILSYFAMKAKQQSVELSAEVNIPAALPLSDTELCALLSNGLDNAVSAAAQTDGDGQRTVRINCQSHKENLLIYINNPYRGTVVMREGLPESSRPHHGFGAKSIRMITENHNGYCAFEAKEGLFTLKVVIPFA
jgi:hypothetical protein